ncbi:MAG: Uncharacterized protein FD119_115 [Stygiobacter sp.]|nr:MAG: Uncharacterized protein FD119_115 [Stygiobacter sp.]
MSDTGKFEAYASGVYRARYETPMGQWLWEFVNHPDNVIRMTTATLLGRPAAEALGERLAIQLHEAGFDDGAFTDRDAQMVGNMIKQVLEPQGYEIDQVDVRITSGALFTCATRYKRRDAFTFHVFRARDFREVALTASKEAIETLPSPPDGGRWRYDRAFSGDMLGVAAFGLVNPGKAKDDIRTHGFHRYRQERMLRAPRQQG